MDLVHAKTTFNNGVLNIVGTLDSHYATDLGWTIDNAKVYSFEYINGESQFVQIITTTEIDTTNPAQVKILIKGLENKLVKVKFFVNMNSNPYVLCGFEEDIDSITTIIQSNYYVDLYSFYNRMITYMSELNSNCCEIPYYLTDTILKYNLFKSSLMIGDETQIIPLYIKFYYGDSNTNPRLLIHGTINNFAGGCNCNG